MYADLLPVVLATHGGCCHTVAVVGNCLIPFIVRELQVDVEIANHEQHAPHWSLLPRGFDVFPYVQVGGGSVPSHNTKLFPSRCYLKGCHVGSPCFCLLHLVGFILVCQHKATPSWWVRVASVARTEYQINERV